MFKLELEYKDEILFARLKGNLDRKASYKINNYLSHQNHFCEFISL